MRGSGNKILSFDTAELVDLTIGVADDRRHSRAIAGKDSDLTD